MRLRMIPVLHRATHRVAVYLQEVPGLGITQAEAHLLAQLVERGTSSIAALHAAFGHRRSTLTSILDRMEARSLVRRQTDPRDRRSFLVKLTRQGREAGRRARRALLAFEAGVRASCAPEQIAAFVAVAEALAAAGAPPKSKPPASPAAAARRRRARHATTGKGIR
jgi:DNA-binding MarR family transcriptional regulator